MRERDRDRDAGAGAVTMRGAIAEKACVAEGVAFSAQWEAFTCGRATEPRSEATRRRERDRLVQRADWAGTRAVS